MKGPTRLARAAARLLCALPLLGLGGCASLAGWWQPAAPKPAGEQRLQAAYELEVRAPTALRALLLEHLDLARFRQTEPGEGLSPLELDRLGAAAPAQARALLETEGYFNAKVSMRRETREAQALQKLVLQVDPGPRAVVRKVELQFGGALAQPALAEEQALSTALRERITRGWLLGEGQAFTQGLWGAAKSDALAQARAGGFPLARWAHTAARVQTETDEVELMLELDSGPLFHLGELQIEGLKHQGENTVRRLAGFEPGQPYSERLLLDFQERLLKTLLFDGVNVDIQPTPADAAQLPVQVPVIVRLRESPRQQATVGVGYNANTGQRVTLEHHHRLPLGLPMRSVSKLDLGRDLRAASLELSSHPQNNMWRNVGSIAIEQDRSTDTVNTSLVARLGRVRELGGDERLDFVELLRAHEGLGDARISAGASSVNTQRIWRRVDSILLPTSGYALNAQLGLGRADNSAGPGGVFGRAQFKLGWYKPIGTHWYGSARLEAGQVLAADAVGLPDKLLFRAGGDDSVRGYGYRSLGPSRDGLAVGGRVLLSGSLELARPISAEMPSIWGAVFVDAGNAAERWAALSPALGYGVGVRWRSPLGPLRLDLARGHELAKWRLHFSVGIAL